MKNYPSSSVPRSSYQKVANVGKWAGYPITLISNNYLRERLYQKKKLLEKALNSSKSLKFEELVTLVEAFGFTLSRIRGSHHIYTNSNIDEILNLQNKRGEAIAYQVRQFLRLIEEYSLTIEDD